jgi:hypothetical protein
MKGNQTKMTIKDRGATSRALHAIKLQLKEEETKKKQLKRTTDEKMADIIRTLDAIGAFSGPMRPGIMI